MKSSWSHFFLLWHDRAGEIPTPLLKKEGELGLPAPAVRAMLLFADMCSNTMTYPKNILMDFKLKIQ